MPAKALSRPTVDAAYTTADKAGVGKWLVCVLDIFRFYEAERRHRMWFYDKRAPFDGAGSINQLFCDLFVEREWDQDRCLALNDGARLRLIRHVPPTSKRSAGIPHATSCRGGGPDVKTVSDAASPSRL